MVMNEFVASKRCNLKCKIMLPNVLQRYFESTEIPKNNDNHDLEFENYREFKTPNLTLQSVQRIPRVLSINFWRS
jgi:hypothetical protein